MAIYFSQQTVNQLWGTMPPQIKKFIFSNTSNADVDGSTTLNELVDFWSSPYAIEMASGDMAGITCKSSLYLALFYLQKGGIKEARNLTINGAFLHQCYIMGIKSIKTIYDTNPWERILQRKRLPVFIDGLSASRNADMIKPFVQRVIPEAFTKIMKGSENTMMDNIKNPSTKNGTNQLVKRYAANHMSAASGESRKSAKNNKDIGEPIKLILKDGANADEQRSLTIGSSTPLKTLFNEYANIRGVSLRSLRFSHAGKILFVSTAGKKTPDEMQMEDQDVILVHDSSRQEDTRAKSGEDEKGKHEHQGGRSKGHTKKPKRQNRKKPSRKGQFMKMEATQEELKLEVCYFVSCFK